MSASLWDGPSVQVVGFQWCKSEPKTVGVGSLTAKILCRRHNYSLSAVDAAGGKAFDVLKRASLLQEKRVNRKTRKRWKVVLYLIDGALLERWFLKTTINLCVSNATRGTWLLSGTSLDDPPLRLVRAAFGSTPLEPPLGLYAVATVGENIVSQEAVEIRTLLTYNNALGGMLFTFHGFRFFLNLAEGAMPASALLPSGEEWLDSGLLYHVRDINNNIGKKLSHRVRFLWT